MLYKCKIELVRIRGTWISDLILCSNVVQHEFSEAPACVRQHRHDENINAHIEKLLNDSSTSQYFYLLGSMKVIIFHLFVFMPGPSFRFDVSLRLSLFSSNWLCMCLPECYTEGLLWSGLREQRASAV